MTILGGMGVVLKRIFTGGHCCTQHTSTPTFGHGCIQRTSSSVLPTYLLRHSQGNRAVVTLLENRVEDRGLQLMLRNRFGSWFTGLSKLGQELISETKQTLRVTRQSMSMLGADVTVFGRWKKLYERNCHHRSFLPPFGLTVSAVTLACTRSHVSLRVLAILLGEATWIQRSMAEAEQFYGSNQLLSQSQLPSMFLASLVFSLLEVMALLVRSVYLVLLFSPAIAFTPFADVLGSWSRQIWLRLVRHSLELGGAALIKWGQWAATRPDLFPRDLCEELTELHTKAPAHKFAYTRRTVEGAFGRKLNEIFEDFEEEPVASGSIAQVHRAVLRFKYPGKKSKPMLVAVKVRHPGVSDVIRRDFVIINCIARISSLIPGLRWLRLEESVQQFAVFMLTQVDLAREAAHLSRFIYNFRRWKDVSFPKPLYPLVHPAVLVETYEQGESVSRFVEQSDNNRINSALAHIGTHTLLKMLLVDNFIHADMHPGNILVRVQRRKAPSGKGLFRSRPHVVFLDVGMIAELSKKDRQNLLEFFKAVALRDGHTAAECTLKFSRDQCCPDPASFIKEVETSFSFWGTKEGEAVHPAECIQELLEQVRRHKVNIDGDVCTVMVTTLVLQGWQRRLDPEYNIMNTLQTLLFKVDWAKSLSYTIEGIMAP
eukprot:c24616_g1_i1 orf=240-2204(+)